MYSVLSSDEDACCLLAGCPAFPRAALNILRKYPGRQDIVVRITYCLGGITYSRGKCLSFMGHLRLDYLLHI
jgi:hypothetical protein